MSTQQGTLFNSNTIPLAEQISILKHQLDNKCQNYCVTFGMFKGKKGPAEHNAMVVITDKSGFHYNCSLRADTIHQLVVEINDALKQLTPNSNEKSTDSAAKPAA